MPADANMQKAADFAKVSAVDFAARFETNINQLAELLGITRRIEKKPGQVVKTYKVTGKLEDGNVAEGEVIPLSKYKTEVGEIFELKLKKWRKQTSYEAINDKGYEQAVEDTDAKMLRDVQESIRKDFFDFLPTGTGTAAGEGLQGALAACWTKNQVLWEDTDASGYLYFVNPEDIGEYLAKKDVTVQTAFGMTYLEAFLGIYDVLVCTGVPKGKVITTAKDNIILYYTNPKNGDVAKAFEFVTDTTGLIGVHRTVDYDDLTTKTTVLTGSKLFAEVMDGIVVCAIEAPSATPAPNPAG